MRPIHVNNHPHAHMPKYIYIPHRPYSPDLLLLTFDYSLSSEAVVMRQLR